MTKLYDTLIHRVDGFLDGLAHLVSLVVFLLLTRWGIFFISALGLIFKYLWP